MEASFCVREVYCSAELTENPQMHFVFRNISTLYFCIASEEKKYYQSSISELLLLINIILL